MDALVEISRTAFDAVVFDLDGVVTDTASSHEMVWKELFDDFLAARPQAPGEDRRPFDNEDYRRFVDGRARFDGALGFLTSRGITITTDEVQTLAADKDLLFQKLLVEKGARLIPGAVPLLTALRGAGFRTAIVSASRNCSAVLSRAGLTDFFDARVDGVIAAELGLPGKPDPAVYLEATDRLRTTPERSVVVEDALAGVEAGRRGGFGLVVGVDGGGQGGHGRELLEHGANVIVSDLTTVQVARAGPVTGAGNGSGRD